jgi:hypothetical protein
MNDTKKTLLCLMVGIASLGGGPCKADFVVYDQPAVFPATSPFHSWTSSFAPGIGIVFQTYDNFTLSNAAAITSLDWQGFTFSTDNDGPGGPVQSFNINFYADNGGQPASEPLFSETVSYTATTAGTTDFFNNGESETVDNYTASLALPFTATAGTTYWLSIVGTIDAPDLWSWSEGSGGDGTSLQFSNGILAPVGFTTRANDEAFTLLSAVPEPSSIGLLFTGLLPAMGAVAFRVRLRLSGRSIAST